MNFVFREMHHVEILITSEGLRPDGNSAVNIRELSVKYTTELLTFFVIQDVSKPMSETSGYSPPLIKQKSSYQHGSKSEHVPRYPLLCRNLRNAVINKKHATVSNA